MNTPGFPASGINEGPDDYRRTHILGRLAEAFPNGSSPERSMRYIKDLRRHNFTIKDVREGVERVICGREQATFPPFAALLRYCNQARSDRLQAERSAVAQGREPDGTAPRWNASEAAVADFLNTFKMFRGKDLSRPSRLPRPAEELTIDDYGGYDGGETIEF